MEAFRTAQWSAVCMAACMAALSLRAQTPPSINAPDATPPGIQTYNNNTGQTLGPAITANTSLLPYGFSLIVNGTFDTTTSISLQWSNPAAPAAHQTMIFGGEGLSVTPTQLEVFYVPTSLYTGFAVTSPETVTLTVIETPITSGLVTPLTTSATFTLNPPFAALASPVLTAGTVGLSYSAPLATGGTGPFGITLTSGSFPAGLLPGSLVPGTPSPTYTSPVLNLSGTPAAAGSSTWGLSISDAWGNGISIPNEGMEVVTSPAILPPLSPSVVLAGSPDTVITITGSGFVAPGTLVGVSVPGSVAQLLTSSSPIPLATVFVDSGHLTATVPAIYLASPGILSIQVVQPGGAASGSLPLTVGLLPTLATPAPITASPTAQTLVLTGTNFGVIPGAVPAQSTVILGSGALPTTLSSSTSLSVSAVFNTPGAYSLHVENPGGILSNPATLTVLPPVQILTPFLPTGVLQQAYDAKLAATGGLTPYTWSASGLGSLSINRATGEITGTITGAAATTFPISVTVTDANGGSATSSFTLTFNPPSIPKLQFTTVLLANGQVGVAYNGAIMASGGSGNYNFSLTGGSVPAGLYLNRDGGIRGTPTTAGTSTFTVQVTDDAGNTASSGFSLTIVPAPLTVTGPSPIPNVTVGTAFGLKFGATGGYPPYNFNYAGNLPPGATLGKDGSLNGSATTAGTFSFTIYVFDSQQGQATQAFTLKVVPAPLSVTATLGNGQVGVAYSGTIAAAGGAPPYQLSVNGLPAGVSFSNGQVSGTPTTVGSYTVTVAATDSAGAQASGSFPVTIAPGVLTVTGSLDNGTVGVAYSGSVSATGGVPPYNFSFGGLPGGVTGNSSGSISGTPTAPGTFTVTATVNDSNKGTANKTFTVVIGTAPLTITAPAPNATVGTAVSGTFSAAGGVPPYTWSSGALPGGLTLSSSGSLSGTPTAPGSSSVTVTVKDSAGHTATTTITITVALPPAPAVSLTGLPPTSSPGTQSNLQIGIGAAYPVDVTVTLTLTFTADSGPDDPTVQFATGGRTATLTIAAGSLLALNGVGVQTGTVAGTATITAQLTAAGTNITSKPAPTETVRINAAAPSITSVTATISGSGFTVTVIGFATTRSITSAVFTFTPASGANLQTTSVTIPVDQIFASWYGSSAAGAYGSQFTYTQPFNVSGGISAIASVSVTLTNPVGTSNAVSATLH